MKPLIIDTSVWIEWIRGNRDELREESRGRVLYLPAIVSMELLSGARTRKAYQIISDIIGAFERNRRLLVPTNEDFKKSGSVLADLGWPASKKSNDVIISVCARKIGAELWTFDYADFKLISEILHLEVRKV